MPDTTTTTTTTYQGMTAKQWADEAYRLMHETQENYKAIAARQARENTERTTTFAVEIDDHVKHESDDYATAATAAGLYDNAHVVTRTTTPWKRIETTTRGTEQALAEDD